MLCIIQARFSSKRLPGKVLKKISGVEILKRVVNQVNKSKKISEVIIATSKHYTDKKIINFCNKNKISFVCGPLNNVFKRFYQIIKNKNYSSFVRITGDSPLLDFYLINKAIKLYDVSKYDIVTNVFPRTFPKGYSVEVISSNIILKSFSKIKKKKHQEHLTSFFYENYKKYKIKNFCNKINYSHINLSVDNRSDLIRIKKIINLCKNKNLRLKYILSIYKKINEK